MAICSNLTAAHSISLAALELLGALYLLGTNVLSRQHGCSAKWLAFAAVTLMLLAFYINAHRAFKVITTGCDGLDSSSVLRHDAVNFLFPILYVAGGSMLVAMAKTSKTADKFECDNNNCTTVCTLEDQAHLTTVGSVLLVIGVSHLVSFLLLRKKKTSSGDIKPVSRLAVFRKALRSNRDLDSRRDAAFGLSGGKGKKGRKRKKGGKRKKNKVNGGG